MPDELGVRLRAARQRQGLSLRSLANSLEVSASMISQVEMGKTRPSVATLAAMAARLGVSLDELVGNVVDAGSAPRRGGQFSTEGALQRRADNPTIEMESGCRWERLASGAGGPQPILVTYQPGGASSKERKLMRHEGREHAYLIEGTLTVHLDFDVLVLHAGDSLCFDAQRPHLYANDTDQVARGVWTVTDASSPEAGDPAAILRRPTSAVDVLRAIDRLD
ncbi:MAG: helix-turn-helix domain-containing protein [Propioniciclava sp.]